MAVKVNIRAEVNQAIGGLKDLKAALYEVGAAGKGLDDVGKQFSGDWYEKLGKVSDEFDRIRDNFEAMRRTMADMRRVTEMAAKHGYKKNDPLSYVDKISTFYANSEKGDALQAKFALNLANGLGAGSVIDGVNMAALQRPQWEKPAFKQLPKRQWDRPAFNVVPNSLPTYGGGDGGGSSGGGSSGGGGSDGSGGTSFAWGKNLKWAGGMMLGLAGINSIRQVISSGVRSNESEGISTESIFRRSTLGTPYESLVIGMRDLSRVIQLSSDETAKLADEYVRASGTTEGLGEKLYTAVGFGRGFGMDPGISSRLMGQASLVGYSDKSSQREFAALLAHTIGSSHMFARSEQIMEDMVNHLGTVATREGRTASLTEMTSYGALMGALYGNPAMAGGGGQSFLQGLHGLGTGGDLTKEMFAWQSLGQAAGYDFIKMEKLKDASPFASIKDILGSGSDKTKLELMWPEVMRQSAWLPGSGPIEDKIAYFLKTQTGMNMNLGSAGVRLLNGKMGDFGMFKGWLESTTKQSLDTLNPEAFGELAKLYEDQSPGSWRKIAGLYTQGDKASKADRDKLQQLLDAKDDAGLRAILPQIVANTGAPVNPQELARDAEAKLTTAITELTTPVRELGTAMKKIAGIIPDTNGPFAQKLNSAADFVWGNGKGPSDWFSESFPGLSSWLDSDPIKRGVTGAFDAVFPPAGATMGAGQYGAGEGLQPFTQPIGLVDADSGRLASTPFGRLIARGEGDYNSVNRGKAGGYRSGKENLEGMTVREVMQAQKNRKFNAAGRYQIVRETMQDAYRALKLTGDEKFDRETQDRIFEKYLAGSRRPAIRDYISGKSDNLKRAVLQASMEWASVASPETGRSYYHGKGKNRASISVREMESALKQTRSVMVSGNAPASVAGSHKTDHADTSSIWFTQPDSNPIKSFFPVTSGIGDHIKAPADQEKSPRKPAIEGIAKSAPSIPVTDEAPKTPADQDKVVRELTTPNQANARVDGHHTLDIVMRNADGKQFYQRRGLALSEPQVFGSPGERKVWSDTATMPAS